jgi:lysophospholipase L1-like esterase
MNTLSGWRRMVFAGVVSIVLVTELVVGSVLAFTATGTASQSPPMTIAVVGDSYTAGVYNRVVWPTLLAQRTGWSVANFALPETGFDADGQGGHAFTYQVDRAQAVHPRIILIVGGLADTGLADTRRISVGAIDAINKIKIAGQRALIVGPTWYATPVPTPVRHVSDAIQKVAADTGVPYLDALDPPWLKASQMRNDMSGPTDEGQSVLADKIAAWLRAEVAR